MFRFLENLSDYAALPLRLGLGALFLYTGINKAMDVAAVSGMLGSLGFPAPIFWAYLLMLAEIVGGAFLVVGFLTRLASGWLGIVLLTAIFTVHIRNLASYPQVMQMYMIVALLGGLIALMLSGPGKWSLDELFLWE